MRIPWFRIVSVCIVAAAVVCPWTACSRPREPDACKILLVGDTSFGENYQLANQRKGMPNILRAKGYDHPLARVKPLLAASDLVIANLETPVTNLPVSPFTDKKTYVHWTDVKLAPEHLARHNIRVVSLANNHTLDYGAAGLRQTLDVLAKSRIATFGAGRNEAEAARPFLAELPAGGRTFKLAVLGAFEYSEDYDQDYGFYARGDQPGTQVLKLETLARQIAELKKADADRYVVAFPHWGENYEWKNDEQTRLAHGLIDAGADLVVGHGAHMMQEIEPYRGRWIVYSLGNFMFNSPGRYEAMGVDPFSLAAQLVVRPAGEGFSVAVRLYPLVTDNRVTNYQSRPVTEEEFDRVVSVLSERRPDRERFTRDVHRGVDGLGLFLEFEAPLRTALPGVEPRPLETEPRP